MRSVLSGLVLAALAANPCLAKERALHGAGAASNGASGKAAGGANPAPSKGNQSIDKETTVAPPVLPPHGVTHQQFRIVNPGIKPVGLGNLSHNSSAIVPAPTARNAIGQPVAPAKAFIGAQSPVLALQRPVASPPPSPAKTPSLSVSPAATRVNLANATNRGSVNGATVVRPAAGPALIGGPARVRYGINGTMVQNKH